MKLPFEFGIKLIFRLVLPGFLLSLGLLPLLNIVLKLNGRNDKAEYAFVILVILLGWLITISDMPIYMLMEGRKFWLRPIRGFFTKREKKRLARIKAGARSSDRRIRLEAIVDRQNFPLDQDGEYEVVSPSRLGNLLSAFEGYAERMYGINTVFYWYRIWLKLDKDVREEVDNMQALADSTTYSSFALALSGVLWVLYVIAKYVNVLISWGKSGRLGYDLSLLDQMLPRKGVAAVVAAIFISASFIVYRVSLRLHAQYGELFKSIFDLNVGSLDVSPITEELSRMSADSPTVCLNRNLTRRDQFEIAWRYLQFYRYRCPACNTLLKINEIKTHICEDRSSKDADPNVNASQERIVASPFPAATGSAD
jgi:hypothetical protein